MKIVDHDWAVESVCRRCMSRVAVDGKILAWNDQDDEFWKQFGAIVCPYIPQDSRTKDACFRKKEIEAFRSGSLLAWDDVEEVDSKTMTSSCNSLSPLDLKEMIVASKIIEEKRKGRLFVFDERMEA